MKSELEIEAFTLQIKTVTVLSVSQWFYPSFTGASIRFQRYALRLKARDIDLYVFTKSLEN